jgi:hypothetical protein
MEFNTLNQQSRENVNASNAILQLLDNNPFIDDKDKIVNEQEQNEIVNPSEEKLNEKLPPIALGKEDVITSEIQEVLPTENKPDQETNEDSLVTEEK